eukprot:Phypoly_transcript_04621.p1 GENE.Phypoly_transcript_04621~~Phypoly_transcript_04621.p1  ORF type:complete len:364 (-),score=24.15 Phypoly_transcript_04621:22-1113(-)
MSSWVLWLFCVYCIAGTNAAPDARWTNSRTVGVSEVIPNQKVFILTLPRSGSSFVGEIFLHNPDFMYLFEPARIFSENFKNDSCSPKPSDPAVAKITKALYDCDFSILKRYSEARSYKGYMYSWERITSFSGKEKTSLCLPPNATSPEARSISVAIKEIEMWAPKLNWLYETVGSDLYVIWLVRDVRGWVSSWLVPGEKDTFFKDWGYDKMNLWDRYAQCDISCWGIFNATTIARLRGILTNRSTPPHLKMAAWWTIDTAISHYYFSRYKGKVLLLKYEDIATRPFEATQQVYAFLNRPHPHEKVYRYLAWATKEGDVSNRYDTYRNSNAMASVWQTRLTTEQIKEIQDIAGIWFPYFGYSFV